MILLADLQYFPPSIFYTDLSAFTHIILDQYEDHRKLTFSNRCVVAGPNGPIRLSIPLQGGRSQKTVIKDVRIANQDRWQATHWKTLTAGYNRSPFFEFYGPELEGLFQQKVDFLVDWNLLCMQWTLEKLKLRTPIKL